MAGTSDMMYFFSISTNYTLENLLPHTTYEIFVAAHTIAGAGPTTHLVTLLTQEEGM